MKFKFYYLLISFFIGISFMSLPFVHYLKNEVKKEIKIKIFQNKFNKNLLHQFSVNDLKKANWTEEKEFILNHYFYDVVSIKIINGQKVYYCFQDRKETKIANIETKIHDFFAVTLLRKTEVKTYFAGLVRINNVSKEAEHSLFSLSKSHFLKSQFQSYQLSLKTSDFIDKLVIPPEV